MSNKNNVKSEVVKMNKKVRTVEQIANNYYEKVVREINRNIKIEEIKALGEYAAKTTRDCKQSTIELQISSVLNNKTLNQREYNVFWEAYKTFFGEKYEKLVIKLFNYLIENRDDIECISIDWLIDNYIDNVKDGCYNLSLGEVIEIEMAEGCVHLIDIISEADEALDLREVFSEEDVELCRNIRKNWFNHYYVEHIFRINNMYSKVIEEIR